ncbi:MAG: Mur ligase family protein, partial [Colwellia sp.]
MMFKSVIKRPLTAHIKSVLADFAITLPETVNLADYQGDLTNDSRTITEGDIFCAVIGQVQDGRQYIDKAIADGAKLVLAESENNSEHGNIRLVSIAQKQIAIISFYQLNKRLFTLASAYYQRPQQQMTMIGITGTNGKTSTSQLLGQLFTLCNKPCAIIGTNGAGMVDDLTELQNTTPSATDLMQLFYRFSHAQVKGINISHIAMEVSSHALEQGRINGDVFDIAVFTNLSRDHLDYHGTMAHYAAAKRALFTCNAFTGHKRTGNKQVAVLNGDDEQVKTWLASWPENQNKRWLYGRSAGVSKAECFVS